jgi:nucleolin
MGNLSWQIDEASLQEAMKECGTITNCKWLEDRDTGKFKGCGFISFETPEAAAAAVAMNGADILGRPIKCDFSQGKKPSAGGGAGGAPREMQAKPEGCTTIFCGNLSFDIDDDKMRAFFSDCGEVSSIRWLTDKDSGDFKGCGFVEFSDPSVSLDKAAKLNGTDCLGRSIRIDYAAPRAPKW